jgi:membrane fusion protein (multidrug efflux system)
LSWEFHILTAQLDKADTQKVDGTQNDAISVNHSKQRKWLLIALSAALPILLIAGIFWWSYASTHENSDDAYVTGHSHEISARLNDTVSKVYVQDNEHVVAGQLLVELDPKDFQDRVDESQAALHVANDQRESAATSVKYAKSNASALETSAQGAVTTAKANISKAEASVVEAQAEVPESIAKLGEADARLTKSSLDYRRYETVWKQGAVTTSQKDSAKSDFNVTGSAQLAAQQEVARSKARVVQAKEQVKASRAQLKEAEGQLQLSSAAGVQTEVNKKDVKVKLSSMEQSIAALKDAKVQLSYCQITSPVSGRVGKKAVESGDRVEPGQPLMAVVSDYLWVVANFKETQLERMRPGQYANLRIDAFPNHKFNGVVESFSPGSGANFALLPSDNATGNFTKIVQRVPVKILFDPSTTQGYEKLIVPGMSVVVTVELKRSDTTNILTRERTKDVDVR